MNESRGIPLVNKAFLGSAYKVVCLDAAALIDSPLSRRGIRRRGGRDTVKINYFRQSIKIIGALGRDTPDMQFHENLATGNVVELLEEIRQKYANIFVIMDNAAAHKSREMEDYIRARTAPGSGGSCPRTPPAKPNRDSGGRSSGQWQTRFLADLTCCRRGSKRCWMQERCPEQDCLGTCWMPWIVKSLGGTDPARSL